MAQNFIFEAQQLDGFIYASDFGAFLYSILPMPFVLTDGGEYTVIWDDAEYTRTATAFVATDGAQCVFVGNQAVIGGALTDEPFAIVCDITNDFVHFFSTENKTGHLVGVYQTEPDEPEEPVGIVIRNYSGTPVTYPGVEKVMFNTSDGGTQIFSKGEAVENVPIAVDFSDGDQVITAPDGTLVKSVIIQKPDTLTPDNIKLGVSIAGVDGEYMTESEDVTVPLAMADGDMVIVPTEGKLLASVTVQKPETLTPENIAEGVEIAGVVGTHSGGGGGGLDLEGDILKYTIYQLDFTHKELTIYAILWDQLYKNTGSYNLIIPDKIGDFDVVINSEGVK